MDFLFLMYYINVVRMYTQKRGWIFLMNKKNFLTVLPGKIYCFIFCLLLGTILVGCAVSDQTDDAVEKARYFAMEKARELTEYQRNIIRYTLPEIQQEEIYAFSPIPLTEYDHIPRNEKRKPHNTAHLDSMAISFVWKVPSLGGEVVVYGTGDRLMRYWEPVKILYRKVEKADEAYGAAREKAVAFAADNMLYLSVKERDRIRFSEAKVFCTSFDLAYLEKNKAQTQESSWESYLREKKEGKMHRFQFSLVWKADDPDKLIVFTGMGAAVPEEKLAGNAGKNEEEIVLLENWDILSVHVLKKEIFAKYIVDLSAAGGGK